MPLSVLSAAAGDKEYGSNGISDKGGRPAMTHKEIEELVEKAIDRRMGGFAMSAVKWALGIGAVVAAAWIIHFFGWR